MFQEVNDQETIRSPSITPQGRLRKRYNPYPSQNRLSMFVMDEKQPPQQGPNISRGTLFSLPGAHLTPPSLVCLREHMFKQAEDLLNKTSRTVQKTETSSNSVPDLNLERKPHCWQQLKGFNLESSNSPILDGTIQPSGSSGTVDWNLSQEDFITNHEIQMSPLSSFGSMEELDLENPGWFTP